LVPAVQGAGARTGQRGAESADRAKIVKVDIDENSELATQYGVQTIPNLLFFRDGQVVAQSVGYVSEAQLTAKIEESLGVAKAAS
jgi:thioredoxin 1